MRRALILTLLWILAFPTTGGACCTPKTHPGLWKAIEDAETIAVIRVAEVHPSDTYSPSKLYHDGYRAGLDLASGLGADWLQSAVRSLPEPDWSPKYRSKVQVLDVLKGAMEVGKATQLHSTLSCTEGGYFIPGRTLIAFLHKRSGGWHPLSWYDSTLYFEHLSDLNETARVILRGVDLQARGPATTLERADWVRSSIRTSGRRWLATRDLDRLRDEEVVRAFVDIPTVDIFNLQMLARLAHVASPEVDRQAMRILEAWLADSGRRNFYSPELLLRLEARLGHPMGASKVSAHLGDGQVQQRWLALRQQLKITDLDAAEAIAAQTSFSAWLDTLYRDAGAAYK